ncbi:MAG: hypothetical protein NZ700_07915 [Gemmataceae bacterium]|nr:hypothetical protein [Gemmataceae bacterium]MDW8265929.1 hypothetical protein [Gemmataceae bacterium]
MAPRHSLVAGALVLAGVLGSAPSAEAQNYAYYRYPIPQHYTCNPFWYYPYYYFPHSYWPQTSPRWPERPGEPYQRPPAYMAYPPFREPHWRYEAFEPMPYHRGFHFWLDQF